MEGFEIEKIKQSFTLNSLYQEQMEINHSWEDLYPNEKIIGEIRNQTETDFSFIKCQMWSHEF